jgi:hypothetical protein
LIIKHCPVLTIFFVRLIFLLLRPSFVALSMLVLCRFLSAFSKPNPIVVSLLGIHHRGVMSRCIGCYDCEPSHRHGVALGCSFFCFDTPSPWSICSWGHIENPSGSVCGGDDRNLGVSRMLSQFTCLKSRRVYISCRIFCAGLSPDFRRFSTLFDCALALFSPLSSCKDTSTAHRSPVASATWLHRSTSAMSVQQTGVVEPPAERPWHTPLLAPPESNLFRPCCMCTNSSRWGIV